MSDPDSIFIELSPEELEEQYRKGFRDREVDQYYCHLGEIEAAIKDGDFSSAIRASKASLPLLGALIRFDQKFSEPGKFMISRIPAIDHVGKILAAMGDRDALCELGDAVQKHPECVIRRSRTAGPTKANAWSDDGEHRRSEATS